MSQKEETQVIKKTKAIAKEELTEVKQEEVIVLEVEQLPDGTSRIGNSIKLFVDEALARVDMRTAKFPELPIGVIPEKFI